MAFPTSLNMFGKFHLWAAAFAPAAAMAIWSLLIAVAATLLLPLKQNGTKCRTKESMLTWSHSELLLSELCCLILLLIVLDLS